MTSKFGKSESELSRIVVNAYLKLFPKEILDVDSDFFELGGDSLMAQKLCLFLEKQLGTEVHPSILFIAPTPAMLTVELSQQLDDH